MQDEFLKEESMVYDISVDINGLSTIYHRDTGVTM